MIEVDVVMLVACAVFAGSVTSGWLGCEGFVESHCGSCGVFFVGEWSDVLDGRVEPGPSPNPTG